MWIYRMTQLTNFLFEMTESFIYIFYNIHTLTKQPHSLQSDRNRNSFPTHLVNTNAIHRDILREFTDSEMGCRHEIPEWLKTADCRPSRYYHNLPCLCTKCHKTHNGSNYCLSWKFWENYDYFFRVSLSI